VICAHSLLALFAARRLAQLGNRLQRLVVDGFTGPAPQQVRSFLRSARGRAEYELRGGPPGAADDHLPIHDDYWPPSMRRESSLCSSNRVSSAFFVTWLGAGSFAAASCADSGWRAGRVPPDLARRDEDQNSCTAGELSWFSSSGRAYS
jgi:hypothetical protein